MKRRGRSVFLQLEVLTNKDQTKSRDALVTRSARYKQGWASENRWQCLEEASQRSEGGCTRDKLFLSNPSTPSHVISSRPLCESQDVFTQISHMRVLFRIEAKAWLNTVFFSQ